MSSYGHILGVCENCLLTRTAVCGMYNVYVYQVREGLWSFDKPKCLSILTPPKGNAP